MLDKRQYYVDYLYTYTVGIDNSNCPECNYLIFCLGNILQTFRVLYILMNNYDSGTLSCFHIIFDCAVKVAIIDIRGSEFIIR